MSLREELGETDGAARIEAIALRNFRSYESLDWLPGPGFNVVSGPNAQGKTNLLEAVYLAATGQLLRGRRDGEAIRDGSEQARVEATLAVTGTRLAVCLERGARKRALINGMKLPRAADILGRLPVVGVTAEDLAMVRGDPSDRREFLDLELSKLHPRYLRALTQYKRALEHRNATLRDSREAGMRPDSWFEPWEVQLAESGAILRDMRQRFIDDLAAVAGALHARMGNGETLGLAYQPSDDSGDPDSLRTALAQSRTVDLHRGSTGIGPHRDELRVTVDGREARYFGSQGQQRTAVITLKMATLTTTFAILRVAPLLLLDDILSDLDARRRELLVELVLDHAGQAILTCTEAESAGARILAESSLFTVREGTVTAL